MISFFRRFLTSPLALGLLALVLIAFVVTGIRTGGVGGGAEPGTLVRVGDRNISENDFDKSWQRAMVRLQATNPKLTPQDAARAGAVDQLLEETVVSRALEGFAAAQGIAAGEKLVSAEIAAIPQFKTAGQFNQRAYEAALQTQHLTDREVREGIRGEILSKQMLAPIGIGAATPEGAAMRYAGLILEAREGLIGLVPAAALTGVPVPTHADLARFYGLHKAQFTIPERRSFRYALIDPAALGSAPVADTDVAAYYKAHATQYAAIDKRRLAQSVVPDEAAAKQLAATGQTDTEVGFVSEADFAAATSAEVARMAFAAPAGGIAGPVKSDLGWHVVKVEAVQPGQGRSLDVARPEIVATLQKARGQAKLNEVVEKLQAALGKGSNFGDLATRYGLAAVTTPPLTSGGTGPPGFALDPGLTPLLGAAFQVDAGEPPSVEDLKGRAALFQTAQVTPPTLPPLSQIRDQVAALWTAETRARRALADATAIAKEVNGTSTMAAALAKRGLKPPQPVNVRRIDLMRPNAQVPPPIGFLFTLPAGTTRALPGGIGGAFVVEAVKVTPGNPASTPQIVAGIRQQFAQLAGQELADEFAHAAAVDVGVKRDPAAIARVKARLSGAATAQP